MKKDQLPLAARRGRPLSFNRDAALHRAMLLFWQHGYEATALSDLMSAMGIKAPSIYAAFGDKKQLFLAAVDLYLTPPPNAQLPQAAGDSRQMAWQMLRGAAEKYTGADTPAGCLLASAAISCSDAADDVRAYLADKRAGFEDCLKAAISADIEDAKLPPGTDAAVTAALVMAVIQGMSTLARDGASRDKLMAIAAGTMRLWPASPCGQLNHTA